VAVRDKLQRVPYNSTELSVILSLTMASSNICAGAMKGLLWLLRNYESSVYAKVLTHHVVQLVLLIESMSRKVAANPSVTNYVDFCNLVEETTCTVELYIPHIS
jgi:hypothetical protein